MKLPKWAVNDNKSRFLFFFIIQGHHPPWVDDLDGDLDDHPPKGHHPPPRYIAQTLSSLEVWQNYACFCS